MVEDDVVFSISSLSVVDALVSIEVDDDELAVVSIDDEVVLSTVDSVGATVGVSVVVEVGFTVEFPAPSNVTQTEPEEESHVILEGAGCSLCNASNFPVSSVVQSSWRSPPVSPLFGFKHQKKLFLCSMAPR